VFLRIDFREVIHTAEFIRQKKKKQKKNKKQKKSSATGGRRAGAKLLGCELYNREFTLNILKLAILLSFKGFNI